jgi:LysM repeat protein
MSMFVTLGGMSSVAFANAKYIVSKGDTLFGIARTHHTSVAAIMKDNQLHSTLLQIHQSLRIPNDSYSLSTTVHSVSLTKNTTSANAPHQSIIHVVRPGDTLWQIAIDNHTSVQALRDFNHLSSSLIRPGQKLTVTQTSQKLVVDEVRQGRLHSMDLHAARQNGVPANLIPVYQAAGQKYGIPWTVLAAIHKKETDFSTAPKVSSAGAQGPMQFMPATFKRYAAKAPGCQGEPDVNNVEDAIYTAAHMLAADGYANNPTAALYQYNHSMTYVKSVERLAQTYQV